MTILVTGGAGYIGSHLVKYLLLANYQVVVLDNLSTGNRKAIETLQKISDFSFVLGDLRDEELVDQVMRDYEVDAVMHFAASISVKESVANPLRYYLNNTANTLRLMRTAVRRGVKKFIFSSTAAVYGEPSTANALTEESMPAPINPYGTSKYMSELVLKDLALTGDLDYVALRYFNVAGCDMHYENGVLKPRIGETPPEPTHLIKLAAMCAAKKHDQLFIFGSDFATQDGTAIRDYVHVDDLAYAHLQVLENIDQCKNDVFNVGYNRGTSVKEVIACMKKVTAVDFPVIVTARRAGDASMLVANNTKLRTTINWQPRYDDLEQICLSAYAWEKNF